MVVFFFLPILIRTHYHEFYEFCANDEITDAQNLVVLQITLKLTDAKKSHNTGLLGIITVDNV